MVCFYFPAKLLPCLICLFLPSQARTTLPVLVLAASRTSTRTPSAQYLTCCLTPTRMQPLSLSSRIHIHPYCPSGYNGVNPNTNPVCNQQITATCKIPLLLLFINRQSWAFPFLDQGASVVLTITDRCTGCNITDIDMSPSAFQVLAPLAVGRLHDVVWTWNN
jgi:hypothetical protein